jgi:hypothetical protein
MKSPLWNDMSGNSIYSYSILIVFSRKLMRTVKMTNEAKLQIKNNGYLRWLWRYVLFFLKMCYLFHSTFLTQLTHKIIKTAKVCSSTSLSFFTLLVETVSSLHHMYVICGMYKAV